jgi:hypothetical protein
MKIIGMTFLVTAALFGNVSYATITKSDLRGDWVYFRGDATFDRININREMIATGFRKCLGDTACGDRKIFKLATYGRTKLLSSVHNMGTGEISELKLNFTATEVLKIQGDELMLREYRAYNVMPGAPSNQMLQTIFRRVSGRL